MAMLALFLHLAVAVAAGESPSLKKGLCIPPGENFHCGDLEAFSRASWWYNWHTQSNHEKGPNYCTCSSECGPEPESPSFVPMVWGYHSNQSWHDDITDPVADKYPIILGFNEPDRGNRAFGADLSPEEAAAAWIELQELYPEKILVSPAPAGGKTSWFDPFFEACERLGCRIDYLATHDYADYDNNQVENVMQKLETLYNRYGRKIWLTEFALCCTHDVQDVKNFVQGIIPRLEEADFVYRYSWFITRYSHDGGNGGHWFLDGSVNALFEPDSDELSPVGKLYNKL